MKRTEKIEIRVSQEEKLTLSSLAKQEGESVSGLVRGIIDKYMALNSASTKRRLPKIQMAALLVGAALIGHGLTLLPMHLHERGHQQEAAIPVYYVHGAIENAAFGISLDKTEGLKEINMTIDEDTTLRISLALLASTEADGKLDVSICKRVAWGPCEPMLNKSMNVDRNAPSVLGDKTKSGESIHIFVQEMA